jgi:hypothetical protein
MDGRSWKINDQESMNMTVPARPLAHAQAGFDFGNRSTVILRECLNPFRF